MHRKAVSGILLTLLLASMLTLAFDPSRVWRLEYVASAQDQPPYEAYVGDWTGEIDYERKYQFPLGSGILIPLLNIFGYHMRVEINSSLELAIQLGRPESPDKPIGIGNANFTIAVKEYGFLRDSYRMTYTPNQYDEYTLLDYGPPHIKVASGEANESLSFATYVRLYVDPWWHPSEGTVAHLWVSGSGGEAYYIVGLPFTYQIDHYLVFWFQGKKYTIHKTEVKEDLIYFGSGGVVYFDVDMPCRNTITLAYEKESTGPLYYVRAIGELHRVGGKYVLTIESATGGTTNPLPGSYEYDVGSEVEVIAYPDEICEGIHYVLKNWTLDGIIMNPDNPITILMDSDHTLSPIFRSVYVCIDPGHGGIENGTLGWDDMIPNTENCPYCGEVCKWKYDNFADFPNEKDVNLDIALKLRTVLEAKNIEVVMTRSTDAKRTLQNRCDIADKNDCDIFVSIHCNAQKCPCCDKCQNPYATASGTETYYHPSSLKGIELAMYVQSELVDAIGLHDRKTKSANFFVLRCLHAKMPAVLTEVAFLTNQNDFQYIKAHTQSAAQGIADGILWYLEERGLTIKVYSPVDMVVTDPDGLTISKQVSDIPGATYTEIDLDRDGDLDDQIKIPDRRIGDYTITLLPEPGALPTDTFSLEVSLFGIPIIIAENAQISDIPSQPYIITSTETEIIPIIPIIPATVNFDPDTLNLKGKGKVTTAYVELPAGYDVNQIDVSSIKLNDAIPALTKPTEIGDQDGNGIPDLMVKFNRQDLIAILTIGEATLTVTGEVDGTPFEGVDTVRVLLKG